MDLDISAQLHSARILVVDDVELNRKMLVHSLQAEGFTKIHVASDGAEALAMTHSLLPDIVILDMMMPGMDGFAYCQAIRHDKKFDRMPILVQTVLDQMDNKVRAFKLGATDYICKPIDPAELVARTRVHLQNRLMMEALVEYRARTVSEFESARKMQLRLMPSEQQLHMYERMYDLAIAPYFETSSHLGGDCWGVRPLADNRLAIWMFDFSGHGISAAMNVFRLHTVMQEFVTSGGDPGLFLTTLNRHLHPLLERNEFCTMFYGVIDTEANCLLYSTAASQPAWLTNISKDEVNELSGAGFPLGSIAGTVYETRYAAFAAGDLLLLHSDCLVETANEHGAFISEKQIEASIRATLAKPQASPSTSMSSMVVDGMHQLLRSYSSKPVVDDLTICAFWRKPKATP